MNEKNDHPTDSGYRVMADLAIYLIQQTAVDLVLRPLDSAELDMLAEPLPPPAYTGNEPPISPMCLYMVSAVQAGVRAVHVRGWRRVWVGTWLLRKTTTAAAGCRNALAARNLHCSLSPPR